MSGNHDDILELTEKTSQPQAEKLILLMKAHRPRIQIDRVFQRELKSNLMSKVKKNRKTYSWYSLISSFSLLATCFLFFLVFWKSYNNIHPYGESVLDENIANTHSFITPRDTSIRVSDISKSKITEGENIATEIRAIEEELGDIILDIEKSKEAPGKSIKGNGESSKMGENIDSFPFGDRANTPLPESRNTIEPPALSTSKISDLGKENLEGALILTKGNPVPPSLDNMNTLSSDVTPGIISSLLGIPREMPIYIKSSPWELFEIMEKDAFNMETRILPTRDIALLEEELRSRGITEGFLDITYRETRMTEGKRKLYAIVPMLTFVGSGEELLYVHLLDR